MKILYPNKITGVTATTEAAGYPDDNLLDDHSKKVWKASTAISNVTVGISGGANALGIAGLHSSVETVGIEVFGTNGISLGAKTDYSIGGENSIWIDYEYAYNNHIVLTIEAKANSVAEMGVVKAGISRAFYEPDFSLKEGLTDYSVIKETASGSLYIRKRDVVRTFSATINIERDSDFYNFMRDIIEKEGSNPLFWNITNYDNNNWAIFARCKTMPKGIHNNRDFSTINFEITEAL